jgi:peptide/nickel transport system permease protein
MTDRLRFLRSASGIAGVTIVSFVLIVALAGRYLAPHDPNAPITAPLAGPSSQALLGTDFLGRDVLSRLLYGGRSVIGLAAAATVLAYIVGLAIGLVAGYSRSRLDPALMRTVDVMLAFPPLLFLLVLITGAGSGVAVLVLGVAAIQAPSISRIVRTATLEVSVRGYVEAAAARGERAAAVIGLLTIGINLTGDAVARSLGRSYVPRTTRSAPA